MTRTWDQLAPQSVTQSELSRLSGVSVRTIHHIEQGCVEQPWHESVRRLCAVLGQPARGPLAIDVLGPPAVHRGDEAVVIRSPQQRGLVGLLALHANSFVSPE
ncbi:hypothetical protein ACSHWB_36925 [Lentzea sp. HUAS TT2]|uniref:hypothetical protein n=1 Tax=Lentzea sp. HUAS TT2 TaxID=3447454 RepID=UPI003F712E84